MTRTVQISKRRFTLDSDEIVRSVSSVLPEPIHEHYVIVGGRRFPPKQVIALATGLDRADFTTHQARRILRGLGFAAARRGAAGASATGEMKGAAKASGVEALRPHIGEWVAVRGDEVLVAASAPAEVIAWLSRHDQTADSLFRVAGDEPSAGGAAPA